MTVSFYTLGCKVNQNETDALAQLFVSNGYTLAQEGEPADIYLVNSCTVTAGGDKKSRQWLRRAKRNHPQAITVLTGCYPQASAQEAAQIAEADIITGSNARGRIVEHINTFLQTHQRIVDIVPYKKTTLFEELPIESTIGHTRAFMKIEDGCNRQCAYCVIPRARGNVRSRSEENILKELNSLVRTGFKEVVFSGINLSSYGKDTDTNLGEIVAKAANSTGIERIRLGSLEPDLLDKSMITTLSKIPKLCPQFHLSLQSGSTTTLRRMRRIYTAAEFHTVVENLRNVFPGAVFTTDIIVGFPGETQSEFEESIAIVKDIEFLKVHVFSFSRRAGTPAYDMPEQIGEAVKAERSYILQQISADVRAKVIAKFKGQQVEILLEKPVSKFLFTGYTREYIPVLLHAPGHNQGDIVCATLGDFNGERCEASL